MRGVPAVVSSPGEVGWSERLAVVLDVAADFDVGIPIDHLVDLLPDNGPNAEGIDSWIRTHAPERPILDGIVYPDVRVGSHEVSRRRQARAAEYLNRAAEAFPSPMTPSDPWLRCVAVTGSVAYGSAEHEDDLDFLVVTRRGAVWFFLGTMFLLRRLRPSTREPGDPHAWCFNYVVDDVELARDYATPRGLLFAREALTAKILSGGEFYRGVLGQSPWFRDEAPRLLSRWKDGGSFPPAPASERAPWLVRLLNIPLFLAVATYVQLAGLVRNRRWIRAGIPDQQFRTTTTLGRLTYTSGRFRRLALAYCRASTTGRWEDG